MGIKIPRSLFLRCSQKKIGLKMKSEARTVGDYLLEVPEKRVQALNKLRLLCLTHLPDYEESMVYIMPSYKRDGQVEVAFEVRNSIFVFIF